jgi:hypothetical protein
MAPEKRNMMNMKNSIVSRRALLINGGTAAAAGVILAACGSPDPGLGRIGEAPVGTALPEAHVSDDVLLRTAQSVETLAVEALTDPTITAAAGSDAQAAMAVYVRGHNANIAALASVIKSRGGEVVTEPNTKMMTNYVAKAVAAIAKADVLVFVNALEGIVAATYQAFVAWTNDPALRSTMMSLSLEPSRFSVATAQMIRTGVKGVLPAVDDAGAELPAALPDAFGPLTSFPVVIGKPNEDGAKVTILMETPSLNSLEY